MRRASIIALVIAAVASIPQSAGADGLPLPVEDVGDTGVLSPDGDSRYVTVEAGPDTILQRVATAGGTIEESVRVEGRYTIPAVALDGSPGGLSFDGSTLVLISPRGTFPREITEFVRFETDHLKEPQPFTLRGDFSYDALSPDGKTLYVINYTSPRDPTEYDVRAYSFAEQRLVGGPIVDPNESGEEMYGFAIARVTGVDGRWEYTLYWGREHPFIHALDTKTGSAACIDLDDLDPNVDMFKLGLSAGDGDGHLVVWFKGRALFVVDPQTRAVGEVPTEELAGAITHGNASPEPASAVTPWIGVGAVGLGLGLAALAGVLAVRRRPRALAS